MSHNEWWQIRSFIQANSVFAVQRGYVFWRTQVRDLDTGQKIETIALVRGTDQGTWTVAEARRYFDLPPLGHVPARQERKEVFNLHRLAKCPIAMDT